MDDKTLTFLQKKAILNYIKTTANRDTFSTLTDVNYFHLTLAILKLQKSMDDFHEGMKYTE